MKSGSLIRVSLRLLAFAAVLAAGCYFLRPRPLPPMSAPAPAPIVLEQAAPAPPKTAVTGEWAHLAQAKIEPITFPGYSVRDTDTYDWLPDGRALLVRYADGDTNYHNLYAASSKGVTPLQQFNRRYSRKLYAYTYISAGDVVEHRPPTISAPPCLLSPDGKNLLWMEDDYQHTSLDGMHAQPQIMATAALNGAGRREWNYAKVFPHQKGDSVSDDRFFKWDDCWMRDSRRWIASSEHGYAIIRADCPGSWRLIRFRNKDFSLMQSGLIGEASDGRILTGSGSEYSYIRQATLTRFRPDVRKVMFRNVRISLPLYGKLTGIVLSTTGDKLVWLIQCEMKTAVWITSATGKFSSLSEPIELPAAVKSDSLRWLPDGKHISFMKGETLFKVTLP